MQIFMMHVPSNSSCLLFLMSIEICNARTTQHAPNSGSVSAELIFAPQDYMGIKLPGTERLLNVISFVILWLQSK